MAGRAVTTVADGEYAAGWQVVRWSPAQAGLTAGVYFARLEADGHALARKVVVLE